MDTPFYDAIKALSGLETRFFVPGHKGNAAPFGPVFRYDLTEIPGADDLSHPAGPLAQSQENMTRAYASGATLYSASGSTSCIEAMLQLFVPPGGEVILQRGCHGAALRSLVFLGARPTWLEAGENGLLDAGQLEALLAGHPGAPVYLTSPDYYGHMQDIATLSEVCRRWDSPLLVDNAHGAYLRFLSPSRHPINLGADACADSAHKTLPCLTPAALLHLRDATLRRAAQEALNLYSSTSPAYPVLVSLDIAAGQLLENPPNFDDAALRLAGVAAKAPHLVEPCGDPLRLVLCPGKGGWPGSAVRDALAGAGILPELSDGQRIVLMASPYNKEEDFAKLEEVLEQFPQRAPLPEKSCAIALPEVACAPREAYFAPKERVPVGEAVGRVAAGIDAPCPPGTPLLVPGERVAPDAAALLAAGGIQWLDVVQ